MSFSQSFQLHQCNFIKQLLDLLDGLIADLGTDSLDEKHLGKLIVFASLWSLGAPLELQDRRRLETFLRDRKVPSLPTQGQDAFEFTVDSETGEWVPWKSLVAPFVYPRDPNITPEFTDILVPNVDNTRTDFLIDCIARQGKAVLLTGEQVTLNCLLVLDCRDQ